MQKSLVSVCCLTLNHEMYIKDALEGFLNQQIDEPFEILIYDHGSVDNTVEIIRQYQARYPGVIKLIEAVKDCSHSKIDAYEQPNFKVIEGKYIALCEGQDYWEDPLKLQRQIDFLENNSGYVLHAENAVLNNSANSKQVLNRKDKGDRTINEVLREDRIVPICALFRNILVNEKGGNFFEEWLWCALASYGRLYFDSLRVSSVCRKEVYGALKPKDRVDQAKKLIKLNYQIKLCFKEVEPNVLKRRIYKAYYSKAKNLFLRRQYWKALKALAIFVSKANTDLIGIFYNRQRRLFVRIGKKVLPRWYTERPSFYKQVTQSGLNTEARERKVTVSLTTFPDRIDIVHLTVNTLLNQTVKPDRVVLWLADSQFPNKEQCLPATLLKLKNYGLTIRWCDDIFSYKKLIPTLKHYPNDIIVTADDDFYYPPDWLEKLYSAYLLYPNYINCHRAHKLLINISDILPYKQWIHNTKCTEASFLTFPTSGAGVIYVQEHFSKDIYNQKQFMSLCPYADDLWFWAMCALNKTKIKVIDNRCSKLHGISKGNGFRLLDFNLGQDMNDKQLKQILDCYPEIRGVMIQNESKGKINEK